MSGDERILASWKNKPYTGINKRYITVHHRIRLVYYDDGLVDVSHEIRVPDKEIDKWRLAKKWELREHGIETITTDLGRGLP